jgi:hypothetical protein
VICLQPYYDRKLINNLCTGNFILNCDVIQLNKMHEKDVLGTMCELAPLVLHCDLYFISYT